MKHTNCCATLCALFALAPLAAVAAPNDVPGQPGYTYIQGSYIPYGNAHHVGDDYHGFALKGSLTITRHVFLDAGYDWLDVGSTPLDANRASIGGGVNDFYDYGGPPGTGIGYYGRISYERLALDDLPGHGDADANGYGLKAGLRWQISPKIEVDPHIGWVDYSALSDDSGVNDADGVRYGVRVLGDVGDNIAVFGAYRASQVDIGRANLGFDDEFRIGARLYF